ncbi:unnamed protein product [Tetraodon nigroviridis]|uniref:(spotted green pufferfish) hypothetical protein n=1 Tax=Tetraodon nigroviridis TaxID=99883 RepID=Q4RUV2_TETNG|nr:unnamed protein product [Tetraodon nigroviridis]
MSNSSQALALLVPLDSFGNVLILLLNISLATAIVGLNASVWLCILLNKALRRENRFMYMLSSCLSDICTGVSYFYVGVIDVNETFVSPTRTFHIVPTFLGLSFMAILAAQADRYHAVVSPLKYSQRMTRNRTLGVISAYWIYAFFIVAVSNMVTGSTARKITGYGVFIGNIFAVTIMIGLNIRLFIIARFQLDKEPPSEERESKRASVHLILVVAFLFLGAWLPLLFHVTVCNFTVCFTFRNEGTDPFRILPRINAALTPVMYIRGCTALKEMLLTQPANHSILLPGVEAPLPSRQGKPILGLYSKGIYCRLLSEPGAVFGRYAVPYLVRTSIVLLSQRCCDGRAAIHLTHCQLLQTPPK